MDGDTLRKLRERRGISTDDLALLLNQSLDKSYSGDTIARWERGRPISKAPSAFLDQLVLEWELDDRQTGGGPGPEPLDEWVPGPEDSPPPNPDPSSLPPAQPLIGGSGVYVRACTELWEMIASGVGMMGAVLGSDALLLDSGIIYSDKQALGAAWGKLAETNETFRKMLVGMTEGGAWLQVALVTGTTVSKCWQSHGQVALQARMNGSYVEPEPSDIAA